MLTSAQPSSLDETMLIALASPKARDDTRAAVLTRMMDGLGGVQFQKTRLVTLSPRRPDHRYLIRLRRISRLPKFEDGPVGYDDHRPDAGHIDRPF